MTTKDYEGGLPEGYSRRPNLPQFKVHDECGSVVVEIKAHNNWHAWIDGGMARI